MEGSQLAMMHSFGLWAEVLAPLLLALLSLGLGYAAAAFLRDLQVFTKTWSMRLGLPLVVLLFFTPSLLVAYIYGSSPDWLQQYRSNSLWFNQLFYWLLLVIKMTPVAVLFWLYGAPQRVSQESLYQWKLMVRTGGRPSFSERFKLHWQWWMEHVILGSLLIFLLIFPDFELASRLTVWMGRESSVNPWALRIFDLRVRDGGSLTSTWGRLWPYFLIQAIALVVLVLMIWWRRDEQGKVSRVEPLRMKLGWARVLMMALGAGWLGFALLVQTLYPMYHLVILSRLGAGRAIQELQHASAWKIYGSSLFFACASTLGVMICLSLLVGNSKRHAWKVGAALLFALPGLMGALPLSMLLLSVANWEALLFLRPTPIMAIIGVMLVIWPVALLLRDRLFPDHYSSGLHLSVMLRAYGDRTQRSHGRRINWRLLQGPAFTWMLCIWALAWSDVLINTPLAPANMQGAFAYMYSVMHYGHVYKDAFFFLLAILIPVFSLLLVWVLRRLLNRVLY